MTSNSSFTDPSVEIWISSSSDSECSEEDDTLFNSSANPTEVKDYAWLYTLPPKGIPGEHVLGKWLVFRPFTQLDETWHMIRKEIECGILTESTRGAKCSTLFYNPTCGGPGPKTSGVVCVYTTVEDVDRAGFILIEMLKHDIKYKTDEATLDGKYSWNQANGQSVCLKALYWNDGSPSFELTGKASRGPRCYGIKDEWHSNRVTAPDSVMSKEIVYGRWVVAPEQEDLTELWHYLRGMIESGKCGPVEMICPPKINRRDPNEELVFLLYTGYKNKEFVGITIAAIVQKDVVYQLGAEAYRSSRDVITYNHRVWWNDGEPEYVMTLVRQKPYSPKHI